MSLLDRLKRGLHVLPEDVAPSHDLAALARFVRFPVRPDHVTWKGRRWSSSGRIGGRWYNVEFLARFDAFAPIARILDDLPTYPLGCMLHSAPDVIAADVMPLYEGKANVRGTARDARAWWCHPGWAVGASRFVAPLGAGPYLVGVFSTESVGFG